MYESSGDSPERRIFIGLAVVVVLAAGGAGYKKWRAKHKHHAKTAHVSKPAPSVLAKIPEPAVAPPTELALEIWIKSPDGIARKLIPRLDPRVPKELATFSMMMKNGLPKERQKDVDELDFEKPLGIAIFDAGRFVAAATVKNPTTAKKVIEDYATAEGAVREHSNVLAADMFKGAKTGRYLTMIGQQVFLGSDRGAVEGAAPRLSAAWAIANAQTHDVVAKAPKTWVAGPFAKWAEDSWIQWIQPQLGGATSGPAKALFDEVSANAKATWPGASDVDMVLDVGDTTANATATLRATPGTPFANFLASYPVRTPDILLEAPRDALGGMAFRFPPTWLETARRFMTTPPPGQEIPADLRMKTEAVFSQLSTALDGEVLFASVADGCQLVRFKVKDDERAKKAAKELINFMVSGPQGAPPPPPIQPITFEGGAGEALEIDIPPQPGQPPIPKQGIAWVVRAGHLYVARGTTPRARVINFASPKAEDHAGVDADLKARIGRLPQQVALSLFMAPFRADTPLPAAFKAPPLPEAVTVAIAPTPEGVTIHGAFDLNLTAEIVRPMLMGPPQGAPPPGSLPPDAASGMPPGMPPPGMAPGIPIPKPPPGVGVTPKSPPGGPPPGVPPVSTGYVLPLPKHHSEP
jgi:hypothetical protein